MVTSTAGSNASYEQIGSLIGTSQANGVFNQSGGTNTIGSLGGGYLLVARATNATGTYQLSGGTLWASSFEAVGYIGKGIFIQSGGTNSTSSTGSLQIAYSLYGAAGTGSYALIAGSLTMGSELIGGTSLGTFTQTGGANSARASTSAGPLSVTRLPGRVPPAPTASAEPGF